MEHIDETQQEGYVPRPAWQLWAARVGVVLFTFLVIYQIICIYRGWL